MDEFSHLVAELQVKQLAMQSHPKKQKKQTQNDVKLLILQ
jgi:hypothetical protein